MPALQSAHSQLDTNPAGYYLQEHNPLNDAIRVALQLGKPLLLTGEPGTGKTQLANYAAWSLSNDAYPSRDDGSFDRTQMKAENERIHPIPFREKPFVFNTKTYSSGKDLLYGYDAVSHFQSRNLGEEPQPVQNYIHLSALGQGIAQTWGKKTIQELAASGSKGAGLLAGVKNVAELHDEPRSSVVLIDEIDKAPRDFPNDLLNEVERYEFYISELNAHIERRQNDARLLVIMTSNAEKTLPDAFLRRCIFYHIPTPGDSELVEILWRRLQPLHQDDNSFREFYGSAVSFFRHACKEELSKAPATGELIDWVKVLHLNNVLGHLDFNKVKQLPEQQRRAVSISLHALFKTSGDINKFKQRLGI